MNRLKVHIRKRRKRRLSVKILVLFLPDGYAMLMRSNKAETAVYNCHCPGDMAVRMRKVLASGLVLECVTCFYCRF